MPATPGRSARDRRGKRRPNSPRQAAPSPLVSEAFRSASDRTPRPAVRFRVNTVVRLRTQRDRGPAGSFRLWRRHSAATTWRSSMLVSVSSVRAVRWRRCAGPNATPEQERRTRPSRSSPRCEAASVGEVDRAGRHGDDGGAGPLGTIGTPRRPPAAINQASLSRSSSSSGSLPRPDVVLTPAEPRPQGVERLSDHQLGQVGLGVAHGAQVN